MKYPLKPTQRIWLRRRPVITKGWMVEGSNAEFVHGTAMLPTWSGATAEPEKITAIYIRL